MRIRTLIVDDATETLEALMLVYSTQRDVEIVGTAQCRADALQRLRSGDVNLVSIDVQLGREDGFQLCSEISQSYPNVFITMCSMDDNESYRNLATRSGAHHFLAKPMSQDDAAKLTSYFRAWENARLTEQRVLDEQTEWIESLLSEMNNANS